MIKLFLNLFLALVLTGCIASPVYTTADKGIIIERATGSILVVDNSSNRRLKQIKGLGDLSHASIVYSKNQRFAYVFGRDGGLTKVDIIKQKIDKRIIQSGNSIGGAISTDGKLIAVSNYKPGGVKVFNADTLALVANIPAIYGDGQKSKTVGLVDAPDNKFIFSLYDANQIWLADFSKSPYQLTKYKDIGKAPYDALISGDGRYYIAGLFGEDALALLDLWHLEKGVTKILQGYGKKDKQMPVYKMPHLEGWAMAGNNAFLPAIGQNKVLVVNSNSWKQKKSITVKGQPVFVMAEPRGRFVWVNFAFPNNSWLQVIDTQTLEVVKTLKPGKGVLHMEFTPKGDFVWTSVRDKNQIHIYDTKTHQLVAQFPATKPSGIFFTNRAYKTGL